MYKKSFLSVVLVIGLLLLLLTVVGFFVYKDELALEEVQSPITTGQADYQCLDGRTVGVTFMTQGELPEVVPGQPPLSNALVSLSFDGAPSIMLHQIVSADGARYATPDETLVFWSTGNGAMVLENGVEAMYQNCIIVKEDTGGHDNVYLDSKNNFTLRYGDGYVVDETYTYDLLGPNRTIAGVKFTVPSSLANNTNLSSDSYISVEHLSVPNCTPEYFLSEGQVTSVITVEDDTFTYRMASSTDAGAGNRYEEYVYTIDGSSPCIAIRYFIHYSVFENYPAGTVTEFDAARLLDEFDAIRKSLTIDEVFGAPLLLTDAVYPLYPNLNWQAEEESAFAGKTGFLVNSEPVGGVTDISALTLPFEIYYADILKENGWEEDIALAAGGPGSAVIGYVKGGEYIILQYTSDFTIINENEPAQCPCSVQFSIFSGT